MGKLRSPLEITVEDESGEFPRDASIELLLNSTILGAVTGMINGYGSHSF
ncbi:MAG: hypothetical protein AABX23_03890 [Nanoarchaeota archaeon]